MVMTKDELNQRYDPMNRAELIAECERLRAELEHKDKYYAQFHLEPKLPPSEPGADPAYPPTFAEQNLAGDVHIRPEDIVSYAYPPGERQRYTFAGWGKAMDIGIAIIRVAEKSP